MMLLVVDDEETVHQTVGFHLRRARLLHAYNGWQALRVLATEDVDLVLPDLNLPDTTGFALLGRIGTGVSAPAVMMLSGDYSRANVVRAAELGAFDFLDKCAEAYQTLVSQVEQALLRRH